MLDHPLFPIFASVLAVVMASGMIVVRMRAAKKPASVKKIVLPPLFMSTGSLMFLFPFFQVTWLQVAEAMSVGIAFSILLIITSNFEVKEDKIYLKPSKAFGFILVFLLLARLVLKAVLGQDISVGEISGMFYLLALGMLVTWRIAMLVKYLKLREKIII
ncbi:CcdC family protein [Halalkalibacillus sediminis]|nr:cytochrome c biogenesis protein CcdC [Halalkalibacillus sediminis]